MVLLAFVVLQASCEHSKAPLALPDAPRFSSSAGGEAQSTIAFVSNRDGPVNIYLMNDDGTGVTRFNDNANDAEPTWSPTCQQLAFQSNRDGPYNIYVMNADGTGVTRLTNTLAFDSDPAWSPNGQNGNQIAFASTRDGNNNVYVMNADGTGVTRLTDNIAVDGEAAWTRH